MVDVTEGVSLALSPVRFGSKRTEDIPGKRNSLHKDMGKRARGEGPGETRIRKGSWGQMMRSLKQPTGRLGQWLSKFTELKAYPGSWLTT